MRALYSAAEGWVFGVRDRQLVLCGAAQADSVLGIAQLTRAATSSEFVAKARALLLAKPAAPVRAIVAAVVVLSNDEGLVPDMEIHESLSVLLTVGTPRIDDTVLQAQARRAADHRRARDPDRRALGSGRDGLRLRDAAPDRRDAARHRVRRPRPRRARARRRRLRAPTAPVSTSGSTSTTATSCSHRDALAQPERRRRSLAVEPMTCAPDASHSDDGRWTLAPGESLTCAWGIRAAWPATAATPRRPLRAAWVAASGSCCEGRQRWQRAPGTSRVRTRLPRWSRPSSRCRASVTAWSIGRGFARRSTPAATRR